MRNGGCESVCCCCSEEPEGISPCDECDDCPYASSNLHNITADNQCESACKCHPEAYFRCCPPKLDCCATANTQNYDYLCPECAAGDECKFASFIKTPSRYYKQETDVCSAKRATYPEAHRKWCKPSLTLALKILCKEVCIPTTIGEPEYCREIPPTCRDYCNYCGHPCENTAREEFKN